MPPASVFPFVIGCRIRLERLIFGGGRIIAPELPFNVTGAAARLRSS
jgi:hypothetical protein